MDLLLGALRLCQPEGTFITTLDELGVRLGEMAASGEAVLVDGLGTRVQRPRGWANQKVLYNAKSACPHRPGAGGEHDPGRPAVVRRGWPGSCHEQELLALSGLDEVLDAAAVTGLVDRGFRGMAKAREHWHAPVGDRRTKDKLSEAQRAFNREQAGLRALVEQAIGHLAGAWALRRWRGLLYRVREAFRAVGALICLGSWLHRVPA
jgi:DDE superfamily endonuclease